ncbi:MAG: hypothetical protein KJN84_03420, partial [Bacteroidia bacterium]|nr:hypothetical protein [Bacteroidia bacterium]
MKKTTLLMLSFLFNLSLFAQNYSLDFDGTDDYLDMSSIPASFEYSFEMWFKLDAVTFDTRIVTASSTHNNIYSVALLAGDKLHVSIGGGGAPVAATSTSILPNTWYHIAFIRKSSTEVDFYLNGVQEVTTITIDPSIEWVDEMRLASPFVLNGNPNGLYMDGQIDEFRVWNGSRTAGQIFEHYQREVSGLEFGLNTNYKFDDNASPNDVEDCHNSGTHGVRFGSGGSNNLPQFVTDQPTGLYDIDCLDLVIGCVEESIIDMPIGDSEDNYGNNVGITTDRFIVGVPNDYVDFDKQGSAIINDWDGSNWIETKLTSDSSSYNSQFGYSVDVDGDRAIVGAHFNDVNGVAQVGAAYIYDWDGAMWNETQLVASDGEYYDGFGYDVAIDGDRAVVSAKWDDDQGSTSGSVYVFDYDGTNWIESHKLNQGSYQAGPQFGEDVDLDGDRLVVGAPKYDHSGYNQAGRAYIFDYNGSSWVRTMLQAYDPFNYDAYGTGVSVSGDRVVVGAHADDDAGTSSGSIYVYTYNGSSWNVEKVLGMNIGAFAFFGYNISIDGDRMVVGAYGDLGREGKAIILDWNGSSWDQEEIFASDGSHYDHFGWSVALLGDQCVIGAYFDHLNGANDAGSCYVLTLASGTWGEEKVTESSPISNGQFGNAIAVNGNRMVVGSPYLNDWFGEVSIYDWDGSAWVFTETLSPSAPYIERFGESVSVQGNRIIVGAPWRSNTKGRVYIYDYDGTNWVETYFDGVGNPRFGWEVSSFGDRFVVGAPRDNDNGTYA